MSEIWCTMEELYDAYLDCCVHKKNSQSCQNFKRNEMANLYQLYEDLNNHTYEIGYSDAFCVTRPKLREVFAADFRDRIVHHLLIRRILPCMDEYMINDTYNCRKGRGTDYGIQRVYQFAQEYKDGWVLKCDLQGFFMSIPQDKLCEDLITFLTEHYKGPDMDEVLWLTKMIALHQPQLKCHKKGDLSLFAKLDKNKSLFTNDPNCGLAIGNLTSQIFANFYLTRLDKFIESQPGIKYGRYVDDFVVFSNDREQLKQLIPLIRVLLIDMGLTLHPNKISLQPTRNGFNFIGTTIKQKRLYAGNRTVSHAIEMVEGFNRHENIESAIEKFTQKMNSYLGFMVHRLTYHIRKKLWERVGDALKQYVYMTNNMQVAHIINKHKTRIKLLQQYDKIRNEKKRVCRDNSRIRK